MPIYDFKCQECGEVSEFLVHVSADEGTLACPGCGSHNLKRMLSAPSLLKTGTVTSTQTCCGQEERCESPPCSTGEGCRRH